MKSLLSIINGSNFPERLIALEAVSGTKGDVIGQDLLALSARLESYFLDHDIQRPVLATENRLFFTAVLLVSLKHGLNLILPAGLEPGLLNSFKSDDDYHFLDERLCCASSIKEDFVYCDRKEVDFRVSFFTSGSTGECKEVVKSAAALFAEVANIETSFAFELKDLQYLTATVSPQHIYALIFTILWPLLSARVYLQSSQVLPEGKDFILVSCPAHLRIYAQKEDELKQPKFIFSSGGALSLDDAQALELASGVRAHEVFGSTETGAIAWRFAGKDLWQIFDEVDLRLNSTGELFVKSPFLLIDTEEYQSSDKLEIFTESRQMKHLGRADRIVKVSEKRISLDRLEVLVKESDLVAELRALVLRRHRDELVFLVVLSEIGLEYLFQEGRSALVKVLKKELHGFVPGVAMPRRWRFIDSLPRNAQGKLSQSLLEPFFTQKTLPECHHIDKVSDNSIEISLSAPRDCHYFDGHFDQLAILPGVVQLEWVLHLCKKVGLVKGNSEIAKISKAKFQQPVFPGALFKLRLKEKREFLIEFEYLAKNGEMLSAATVLLQKRQGDENV